MDENKSRRILLVDSDSINVNILRHILMPMYEVIVAKTGQSALQKVSKYTPDIILLDIILPDMSGFDVLAKLKESDAARRIPVIFITSLSSSETEEKGLMLGAVDYITRPFHNAIVKARIHTHLKIVDYINTIERIGNVDALTDIPNRRAFDHKADNEWKRAMRLGSSLGMLMLDIDHFKKYNDTYGHPQGDKLLKAVAQTISSSLKRPADFAARWGGEEFAVLLPGVDANGAREVAEHIRKNVASIRVSTDDGVVTSATISIGVHADKPKGASELANFICAADKALYKAKSAGRNQVCVYGV